MHKLYHWHPVRSKLNSMDIVLNFYKDLPFNIKSQPWSPQSKILVNKYHPDTLKLALHSQNIIDIGCGPGHLINSLNYHCNNAQSSHSIRKFCGIDFNQTAITYGKIQAARYKLDTEFQVKDVFKLNEESFRLDKMEKVFLISIGALHHTKNCIEAIQIILNSISKKKNISFLIGLYHLGGRKPFLTHFNNLKDSGASEEDLRREFARLRGISSDNLQDESWFQDQVNHPRETSHTLVEIFPFFEAAGFYLDSTSVDNFEKSSLEDLYKLELHMQDKAAQRLRQNSYYPGFFTCLFKNY
jgi:SAM-dependent methyltransferase